MRKSLYLAILLGVATLTGCSNPVPPPGVTVVENFNINRYLGTWYEIARLDHPFESGLEQVTATYGLQVNGGVSVINRGYNPARGIWQSAQGEAWFTGAPTKGALKVSFFGPFYGGYNVMAVDKYYQHALLCGPDRSYLWILSRTPTLSTEVKNQYIHQAQQQGFDTSKLIWVKQTPLVAK